MSEIILIDVLELGDRISSDLVKAGVKTLEALRGLDKEGLTGLKGIGASSADQILQAIARYDGGTKESPVEVAASTEGDAIAAQEIDKDLIIKQLTQTIRYAEDVFFRQRRGNQGPYLAGLLRQSVLIIRPELSASQLADIEPDLAMPSG